MIYQMFTRFPRLFLVGVVLLAGLLWLAYPVSSRATAPHPCQLTAGAWESCVPLRLQAERATRLGQRVSFSAPPQLTIQPYVRPEVATRMVELRSTIVATAARHNRPGLCGMSDRAFAEVMALLMYNEHNGWLEDEVEMLRAITPMYETLQVQVNASGVGSDFSVWPSNLRPSVALEILRGQVPVPAPTRMISIPLELAGSRIRLVNYHSQQALFAAVTREISQDRLAVEYLAANLVRGCHRAHFEGVPISWRTLAAWHNQGIVQPAQVRANSTARDYIRRTSAYILTAQRLIAAEPAGNAWRRLRKQ